MNDTVEEHPGWAAARVLQSRLGRELLVACGAHGLDIAWCVGAGGEQVPGLIVHKAEPRSEGEGERDGSIEVTVAGQRITVPGDIDVEVDGRIVAVPLRVEHSPAPGFEATEQT